MCQVKTVEVKTVVPVKVGTVEIFVSQPSHETVHLEVTNGVLDEIFVPKYQTHQVSIVRGKVILVVWQNNKPQDIPLDENSSKVVIIPPDVPYGFINLHLEPSVVINAVIHHQGSEKKLNHHPAAEPLVYERVNSEVSLKVVTKVTSHTV